MRQVTIQKKYLFLVEVAENIWRLFLVIVNFVIEVRDKVEAEVREFSEEAFDGVKDFVNNSSVRFYNFVRSIFGFNIYRLDVIKLKSQNNFDREKNLKYKNEKFLRYSNSLAPPSF